MRPVHAGTRAGHFLTGEEALSPVIGEMLMIVLALLLVSVFSLSLAGLLPEGRDPVIDVIHNETSSSLWLWHKGGDVVDKSDLRVLIIHGRETTPILPSDPAFSLTDGKGNDKETFGLGEHICVSLDLLDPPVTLEDGDTIRLVTSKNVIFTGTASPSASP